MFTFTRADWRLALAAALRLVRVRIRLWVMPFAAVRRASARPRTRPAPTPEPGYAARAAWAVRGVARRLPGMTCLVQAIALEALLADRGFPATLRIGVRPAPAGAASLHAHAWLESDGRVLIGDLPDLSSYAPLVSPADRSPLMAWDR